MPDAGTEGEEVVEKKPVSIRSLSDLLEFEPDRMTPNSFSTS